MNRPFRVASSLIIAAVAAVTAARADDAAKDTSKTQPGCAAPADLIRFVKPLSRVARKLSAGDAVTIVTIGSSSTAGAGASSPAMSYPSRMEAELQATFPRVPIKVINRGANGETALEMLARFDRDVIEAKPDLVIWQVGSNSVLRDQPIAPAGELLREGLRRLKAAGVDVVLMNPQYAPKVIVNHDVDSMVDLIDAAAKQADVELFQRFALMRYWRLTENMPFDQFLSPDELHLNDWSYGCVGKLIAGAIADAATRPTLTAGAAARR